MTKLSLFLLLLTVGTAAAQQRFQDPATQKWGIHDDEWNILLPAIYDDILPDFDTVITVKKDGKMATFDEKGNVRIPLIYQYILSDMGPFTSQYGLSGVTKDYNTPNSWGMLDARGKVLLPETFEYVCAITPYLLVARVKDDPMLQFFNITGELLYKIPGKRAMPSNIDMTSFAVEGKDDKKRYYKLDGTIVYPPDPLSGMWTDGHFTILRRDGKFGVINSAKKTVIPFEYFRILPGLDSQFIVTTDINSMKNGVLDKKGQEVVPIDDYHFFLLDGVYGYNDVKTYKKGIMGKTGTVILPPQYNFSIPFISKRELRLPEMHPERYISATHTDNTQILLKKDGTLLYPEGARRMWYHSDIHPIIIEMLPDSVGKKPLKRAVNWAGKEVLPAEFGTLEFTANPRVLWGSKDLHGPYGFIDLDAPEKAEFKFKRLFKFFNNYIVGQNDRYYTLHSPFGALLHEGKYLMLKEPQKKHHDAFRAAKNTTGKLVAIGLKEGTVEDEWTGINDSGKAYLFKKAGVFAVTEEHPEIILEELPTPSPPTPKPPSDSTVHTWARQPPEFSEGGAPAMINFISINLRYPALARENGIEGTVVATFIVEKDGSITHIQIQKGIGNGCDEEVLRLIKSMPKWKAGHTIEQAVRVKYTLPVEFKLN